VVSDTYFINGEHRAHALGNRGPFRFDANGALSHDIVEAYDDTGFYVFEELIGATELADLVSDYQDMHARAPASSTTAAARGKAVLGRETDGPGFHFAKPLSDPLGGTDAFNGRHAARMTEVKPPPNAPEEVLYFISGGLQLMDSFLRLSGHPKLLAVAEAIYGPDFAPFSDAIWIKEPGLGSSVAWHQDGTTHWDNPDWDRDIHGLNFMTQLHGSNSVNALWVVPGSHKAGKIDIKARVDGIGSDRLPDAVPMLSQPGDVAVCNRQLLHGSFPNTSSKKRVSLVFGAHRRSSVLDIKGWTHGLYDRARVHQRSRVIALAIDARRQRFPDETPYVYQPVMGQEDDNQWSPDTRESVLRNYNLNDLRI
jgi:hypothetical protein